MCKDDGATNTRKKSININSQIEDKATTYWLQKFGTVKGNENVMWGVEENWRMSMKQHNHVCLLDFEIPLFVFIIYDLLF